MINYIIQVLLFQTVFMAVYDLILKKETFFQWNRAYLIITSILAYIIPLIRFSGVSENIPQEYRIMLPEVMLSPQTYIEKQVESSAVLFTGFQWLLITGGLIATLIFIYKIAQIIQLIRFNRKEKNKDYDLVFLSKKHSSFSFFRYIFLGNNLTGKEQIIAHELVHVKQKHSIDLLFFELQKILFWFNPFSYLYQNRMAEIHEFIADAKTVSKKERSTFYNSLLAETFRVDKLAFVNSYNKQSIIKKRIMMFSKEKSKEIFKFKYLLLVPVLMGMLVYTSCESKSIELLKESKIEVKESAKDDAIPFAKIDKSPIFLSCENEQDQKKCFSQKINEFVGDNFDMDKIKNLGLKNNSTRVYVQFIIDKTGNIVNIRARGQNKELENEAIRVINSLPKIQPGEVNGRKVDVKYTLPISLSMSNEKLQNIYTKNKDYSNASEVPFASIDQVPVYPGCEDADNQKACMVEKITEFVSSNFNTSLSQNLGLESGKKRVYVQFTIDKNGKITDVRARGPHTDLEDEAVRIINNLPQMQPGEENGKKVGVKYTLPISLVIE